MAIERTGSFVTIDSSAASGSQSITIPSDCTFVVVGAGGWDMDLCFNPDATPYEINSTLLTHYGYVLNGQGVVVGWMATPPTGSQTFEWTWSSSPDEGTTIIIAFYKGVNTADPVRSHGGDVEYGTSDQATTGSLTAQSGDLVVAYSAHYQTASSLIWTGAAAVHTPDAYNSSKAEYAEGSPTGNVTVTAGIGSTDYIALAGMVLIPTEEATGQPTMRRWANIPGMRV